MATKNQQNDSNINPRSTPRPGHYANRSVLNNPPPAVVARIKEWYGKNNGNLPCKYKGHTVDLHRVDKDSQSDDAVWIDCDGNQVEATLYKPPEQSSHIRIMVVEDESGEVCVVHAHVDGQVTRLHIKGRRLKGTGYRKWIGLKGDSNGFESEPSVFKVAASDFEGISQTPNATFSVPGITVERPGSRKRTSTSTFEEDAGALSASKRTERQPDAEPHSVVQDDEDEEEGSEEAEDDSEDERGNKILQLRTQVEMISKQMAEVTQPKKKKLTPAMKLPSEGVAEAQSASEEQRADSQRAKSRSGSSTLEPSKDIVPNVSPNRIKLTEPFDIDQSTLVKHKEDTTTDRAFGAHILANTTLHFSNCEGNVVRSRPFKACNTSRSLFKQARAAMIFQEHDPRLIAINIRGANEGKALYLLEKDEDDFAGFVKALKKATCWTFDAQGEIQGKCAVDVKEKI